MRRQALEEAALPLMLEAMWAANVVDIQMTLRKVWRNIICVCNCVCVCAPRVCVHVCMCV